MKFSRKFFFFLCLGFVILGLILTCGRRDNSAKKAEEQQLLLLLLQSRPGVGNACQLMIEWENTCVVQAANPGLECNSGLIDRVRQGISPQSRASDRVTELYFRCFAKCNVEFATLSNCSNSRYSNNREYRRVQRALDGSGENALGAAQATWRNCFDSCRSVNGKSPEPGTELERSNTRFPEDWFQDVL